MDGKSRTQFSTLPEFFAPDKLASVFHISRSTLYRALRRGEIPCLRVGKRFILSRVHLERWMEENPLPDKGQNMGLPIL